MAITVDQKKWGPEYVQGVSPSNPGNGQTWYDTTNKELKIYNYTDTANNIQDLSDSSHNISLYGGIQTNRLGTEVIGPSSIQFDGSNDYLELSNDTDWEFGSGDFTIDFWLNFNDIINQRYILQRGEGTSTSQACIIMALYSQKFYFQVSNNGTSWDCFINYDIQSLTNNKWYHITAVRNGTSCNLYINGSLVETNSLTGSVFTPTSNQTLCIGRRQDTPGSYLDGNIDEFRISKGIDRTTDSNDMLYIDGAYHGNSGTLYTDNCQTIWTDADTGDGSSTLSAFDGTDGSFKLDSGSVGAGNYAHVYNVTGLSIPDEFVYTVRTYCDSIGTNTNSDTLEFRLQKTSMRFYLRLASDGLFIYDGSSWNEVGSNVVVQDTWQEWEFVVDGNTPATASCDVYLDGTKIATGVDCSYDSSGTDGRLDFVQYGLTSANNISYIDNIKLGQPKEFELPNDHYTPDTYTKLLIQPEGGAYWHPLSSSTGANYGYDVGGYSGAAISIIDRIMFPFDSGIAQVVGYLQQSANYYHHTLNSSSHGFVIGGYAPSQISTVQRFEFPFDSGVTSVIGNMSSTVGRGDACNSSTHGYVMMGITSTYSSNIDRLTFPFNSGTSTVVGNLGRSGRESSSCNSSTYGYTLGGQNGSGQVTSNIYRILFPFNSGTGSSPGNLSISGDNGSCCNSSEHGYLIGGLTSSSDSRISRITFPFDSGTSTVVGNMNGLAEETGGCNSTKRGYCFHTYAGSSAAAAEFINFPFSAGTAITCGQTSSRSYTEGIDGVDFVTQFI